MGQGSDAALKGQLPGPDDVARTPHDPRFACGGRAWLRQSLAACAEVERAAQRAGVALAEPVALGIEVGDEIVNVHRWWHGRPVEPGDDVAGWLGGTLARLHTLPPPSAAPGDALTSYYGLHPEDEWQAWFREGRSLGLKVSGTVMVMPWCAIVVVTTRARHENAAAWMPRYPNQRRSSMSSSTFDVWKGHAR